MEELLKKSAYIVLLLSVVGCIVYAVKACNSMPAVPEVQEAKETHQQQWMGPISIDHDVRQSGEKYQLQTYVWDHGAIKYSIYSGPFWPSQKDSVYKLQNDAAVKWVTGYRWVQYGLDGTDVFKKPY